LHWLYDLLTQIICNHTVMLFFSRIIKSSFQFFFFLKLWKKEQRNKLDARWEALPLETGEEDPNHSQWELKIMAADRYMRMLLENDLVVAQCVICWALKFILLLILWAFQKKNGWDGSKALFKLTANSIAIRSYYHNFGRCICNCSESSHGDPPTIPKWLSWIFFILKKGKIKILQ